MNPAYKLIELLELLDSYQEDQEDLVKFLSLDNENIISNILEIKLQIVLYSAFVLKILKSSLENNAKYNDPSFEQNYCNIVKCCLSFISIISNSPANQGLSVIFPNAIKQSGIYTLENQNLLRFWGSLINNKNNFNRTSHETIQNTINNLQNIKGNQHINDAICNLQDLIIKSNQDIQSRLINISLAINSLQKSIESLTSQQEKSIVNNAIECLNKLILEQAIVQVGINPFLSFATNLLRQTLSHINNANI